MEKIDVLARISAMPQDRAARRTALVGYAAARCQFMACPFTAWLLMDEAYGRDARRRDLAMSAFKRDCKSRRIPRSVNNAADFILDREGL